MWYMLYVIQRVFPYSQHQHSDNSPDEVCKTSAPLDLPFADVYIFQLSVCRLPPCTASRPAKFQVYLCKQFVPQLELNESMKQDKVQKTMSELITDLLTTKCSFWCFCSSKDRPVIKENITFFLRRFICNPTGRSS